jgi:GNAT superfamily N-acetyltransferase
MNAQLKPQITIQRETYSTALIAEFEPLLKAHWLEIANYRDQVPYDPDFQKYCELDQTGMLFCLTARVDGQLVGYSVFYLTNSPHYKSTLFAINDVFYVDLAHRKGSIPMRLIRESERTARSLGVKRLLWHVKPCNQMSELLNRLGYAFEEQTMGRVL